MVGFWESEEVTGQCNALAGADVPGKGLGLRRAARPAAHRHGGKGRSRLGCRLGGHHEAV